MEIIDFDAFNPEAFNHYQSPAQIEQNKKLVKFLIIFLLLITIASLIGYAMQNKN